MNALVLQLTAVKATQTAAVAAAEQAEQASALATQRLQAAQLAESQAASAAASAAAQLATATDNLRAIALADYMGGRSSSVSILLSAEDPAQVLAAEAMHGQLSSVKSVVIDEATELKARQDAATARARAATATAQAAAGQAAQTQALAMAALARADSAAAAVAAALTAAELTQVQDATVLAALSQGFASTALTPVQATGYAQQAAAAAAVPSAPPASAWSAAIGQSAANRALSQLTVPYSFAGGNAQGPTLGMNSGGGGQHDGSIRGYDCSGLALFAWAPYLSLPHDAASQYTAAGRLHPTPAQLLPGDLIFWSSDGTAAGIHHVAIYIGADLVVQAPQSGDVVRTTPLVAVSPGIFGATRPLS